MGKKIITLAALLVFYTAQSQVSTKLDLHLYNRLSTTKANAGNISLLVKGDGAKIKALAEKLGGTYKYGVGDISSVSIPEKNVIAFSNSVAVKKIQSTFAKGTALMDTARIRNNIDSAQTGYAPLTDSMVGKGVLIGIIDGGIYWQHPDFKNADGSTRILYIWDQSVATTNPPLGYNYGTQWTAADLNDGSCTEAEAYGQNSCASDFSHGTCVAGIAAGNGSAGRGNPLVYGKYTGVAPQSKLIVVNIGTPNCQPNSGNDFLTQISDAVHYIFSTASALGMPCVINISQGTYYGSHDGIDLTSEMIDSMIVETTLSSTPPNQRWGRVVVAAAGNAGNVPYHLSYTITSDSTNPQFTFFDYVTAFGAGYFDLWADTASFNNVWFTVGCNSSTGTDSGHINYFNVLNDFSPLVDGQGILRSQTLYSGNVVLGVCSLQVTLDAGRYHVEFLIMNPRNTNDLWRLQMYATNTTSTFDLWASSGLTGSSDIISTIGGFTIQFPNYQLPDTLKTLVSSWQCSDKVITVGNYGNRTAYLDYDSIVQQTGNTDGQILNNSSVGPTRDNRIKPDISATGTTIICTGDSNDIAFTAQHGNAYKCAYGKYDIRNGGTSMSSPIVAGVAALYLQKRPTAGYAEVKKVLECTATQDAWTGAVPNIQYGYGKVNAYQALINTTCVILGSMDSSCFNYNPLANIDTGTCVAKIYGTTDTACINYTHNANVDTGGCKAKVYGCMDSTASNYNPLANVDNGSCQYASGIKGITSGDVALSIMPNPFAGQTTFSFVNNGYSFTTGEIDIVNIIGEQVDIMSIGQSSANYVYNAQKLSSGVYFYQLKLDNKIVKSGKLEVE